MSENKEREGTPVTKVSEPVVEQAVESKTPPQNVVVPDGMVFLMNSKGREEPEPNREEG